MSGNTIRIVILDNHYLVRAGIRVLLENHPGMVVVGDAGNTSEGLEIVSKLKPDIILLELNLTDIASVEILPKIRNASDQSHILLVTSFTDPLLIQQAIEEGVVGVLFKTQSPDLLIKAIEKVYAGEVWLERSTIASVLSRLSRNHQPGRSNTEADNINDLSEREKEIVRLIGQGYKNKKISAQLYISETTVRHHLTSIYNKLGVTDRLELLVFAHRYGLVKSASS